ncbi:phosphatase [Porphyrobacter sp. HT-58-2]|uniref:alkaline phosphatase PhoX n=1 Tax=Porphyrobacter sp. HT-58-2 TaxID=2023229 RepID=UPI000CDCB438|nr:alkaline phosphatase PhoX [Porphyrobacter sp. HT-58-2]AUX69032.1 phosphatase [Porphyrobacter sp. HT-58-2]
MTQPLITPDRRRFLGATASAFAALAASGCMTRGTAPVVATAGSSGSFAGYGALRPDPAGFLDLPEGFSYRVISRLGDGMDDGGTVPDRADGMGCFDIGNGEIALVRNHELQPRHDAGGTIAKGFGKRNGEYVPGGTTTIVLDATSLTVKRQFRSLGGTIRNCSGGVTPWGSWLTCEEAPTGPGQPYGDGLEQNHGWVFEVPAAARGLVDPVPLKAMGRFNHEAAAVDPATGIVYMTEDRDDGVLYRFVPRVPGKLAEGGRLQAMVIEGLADTRNWTSAAMPVGKVFPVRWVDLDDVEAPRDDLRIRAAAKGAALLARGEGLHMGVNRGLSEVFACCTSGGAQQLGQILKLMPGNAGQPDTVALFFESESKAQFDYGDNLTVAPNGHLIVCEDQYTDVVDNHVRGITPEGQPYTLARLIAQTELAGGCFSPDGKWLFVNAYSPAATLAITGPWAA